MVGRISVKLRQYVYPRPPCSIRDKDKNRLLPRRSILQGSLLHDQIILYGFHSFDASRDFNRFIDGVLRINESAQLDRALISFDTDLE